VKDNRTRELSTAHYTFRVEKTGSTLITNKSGKAFYVMTSELLEFVGELVRLERAEELDSLSTRELLGLKK